MKKIQVLTHKNDADMLIKGLLRQKCVDVDTIPLTEDLSARLDTSQTVRDCEKSLEQIKSALQTLYPYSTRKKSFVKTKLAVDTDMFIKRGTDELTRKAVANICAANERLKQDEQELSELISIENTALAWKNSPLPLGYEGTDATVTLFGTLPVSCKDDEIEAQTADYASAYKCIDKSPSLKYMLFICIKSDEIPLLRKLSQLGFVRAEFPADTGTSAEILAGCREKRIELDSKKKDIIQIFTDSALLLDDIETLYDVETTRLREAEYLQRLALTDECAALQGWVPEDRCEKVSAFLESKECAYSFTDPEENENVPVKLKNNRFASCFEWVIGMYSLPAYGSFDPTFIMSICYMILFAVMFADVGYGLLMVLGGFLIPKLLKFEEPTKRAFNMFGYCGIACIAAGVLFGGYFGDLPLALLKAFNPDKTYPDSLALLVDPVQEPMVFMILGLGLGFIHLVTGQAVKMCIVWKDSKIDAICDYVFYWIIYAGIIVIVLESMGYMNTSVGMWITIAGAALVVLTAGRKEKNILMRLPKGLLGLYGLVNFGSDIISYSRILAIALSGSVLASVFNVLATMGSAPAFRIIGMPFILIVGHVLNLALSALSAFVHTSRLQYVEFFGKFYEDGGRPYAPMLPASKYTQSI